LLLNFLFNSEGQEQFQLQRQYNALLSRVNSNIRSNNINRSSNETYNQPFPVRDNIGKRATVGNGLLTNLASYWKMEEASGPRYDSHKGNDLDMVTGTPPSITGVSGDAADFSGGGTLSVSNSALVLRNISKVSYSCWCDPTYGTSNLFGGSNVQQGSLHYTTNPYLQWKVAEGFFQYSGHPAVGINHYGCVFDGTEALQADRCKLYENGVLLTGVIGGTIGTATRDTATNFQIIGNAGTMDEFAVWPNRALTQADVTLLYNSGTGLFYDDFSVTGAIPGTEQ